MNTVLDVLIAGSPHIYRPTQPTDYLLGVGFGLLCGLVLYALLSFRDALPVALPTPRAATDAYHPNASPATSGNAPSKHASATSAPQEAMHNMHNPKSTPKSKRQENADQRQAALEFPILGEDESGNAAAGGIIAVSVALLVAFIMWGLIGKSAANAKSDCATNYGTVTADVNACKSQIDTNLTIGGVVVLIALLTGGGLYAKKRGAF